MRTRNLLIVFIGALSILLLIFFLAQDETLEKPLPSDASSNASKTASSKNTPEPRDEPSKAQIPALPGPPDLNRVTLDPNKPRPMPAIADTMPSTPPSMPMVVPPMPSEPPHMPTLVMPGDGSMPYDPASYDPKTHSGTAKTSSNAPSNASKTNNKGPTPLKGKADPKKNPDKN